MMWGVLFLFEDVKINERVGWEKKVEMYFIVMYKFKYESSYLFILKVEKVFWFGIRRRNCMF